MRTPTVGPPALTMSGTASLLGKIKVSGPGQKESISREAISGTESATSNTCSASLTWTMSGSLSGRCLAVKILRIASGLSASAPKP